MLYANNTEEVVDNVETLIGLAMYANLKHTPEYHKDVTRCKHMSLDIVDASYFLKSDDLYPESAYTFDMTDTDRLLTTDKDYLSGHPKEILGNRSEIILLFEGNLKWSAVKRLNKLPEGVSVLGKVDCVYERHYREVDLSGKNIAYSKSIVVLDKTGNTLPTMLRGQAPFDAKFEQSQIVLAASLVEDCVRSGTMLARVKDEIEIKFPVPVDNYKEMFAGRDEPLTPKGNRKAILHWVRKHLKSNNNKSWDVKKHIRGVQEFTIDGLKVVIEPNDKD